MELIRRFEKTVDRFTDSVAITDNDGDHTFHELRKKAISIASAIEKQMNGRINKPILICLDEGFDYIAAIIGVLYSGNFYVPITKGFPGPMMQQIVQSIDPALIITDLNNSQTLIKNGARVSSFLLLDDLVLDNHASQSPTGYKLIIDMDPLYIMYTTGSTGIPKGVVIRHNSVIDFIDWMGKTFNITERTIMSCKNPFGFDGVIHEIYALLCFGSHLIVTRPKEKVSDEQRLKQTIHELNHYKVNFALYGPSTFKDIEQADGFKDFKPEFFTHILFAGEVMHNKHLNYWRKHLPHVTFANMYGPTEATEFCTYYIVDREFRDDEPLPIGSPCENTAIMILNDAMEPVKTGETGELYVRGTGVSAGYWRNPDKTAEVFVQNPLHDDYEDICYKTGDLGTFNEKGEIMFLGRVDQQIQFYGARIELGEIEQFALLFPGISRCAAFFVEELYKIILIYESDSDIEKRKILNFLHKKLLAAPTEYIRVDTLPLNRNGKIDRKELKESLYNYYGINQTI
jgi:amino acid adenylation domain-containing protein